MQFQTSEESAGSEAEAQAAAPALLEQCMADVQDDDPASVGQLAGLPLAPLADGRRGTLRLSVDAGPAGGSLKLFALLEQGWPE